jgi:hypothetical protein
MYDPACMISFCPCDNIRTLKIRLRAINLLFKDFEVEELNLYPAVEERIRKRKLSYFTGYRPDGIPAEQI